MNVEVINTNESKKEQYLDADRINAHVSRFFDVMKSHVESAIRFTRDEITPVVKEWIAFADDIRRTKVVFKEVEFLTKEILTDIAKENKVHNSNACAVYRVKKEDGSFHVLLTYLNGRDVLPAEQNCNVFIQAEGMSKEIKEIFGNKDCIIFV